MGWPTHSRGGRHDWASYLERGYADPFREALREIDHVDSPVDEHGRSMLMHALATSPPPVQIASLLIAAGANVNHRDASGRPAWDFAPTWGPGSVEIWTALLDAGLDVRSRAARNETPLVAVCSGYVDPATNASYRASRRDIVRLLLRAGAELEAVNEHGETALQVATKAGNKEAVQLLARAGAKRR